MKLTQDDLVRELVALMAKHEWVKQYAFELGCKSYKDVEAAYGFYLDCFVNYREGVDMIDYVSLETYLVVSLIVLLLKGQNISSAIMERFQQMLTWPAANETK